MKFFRDTTRRLGLHRMSSDGVTLVELLIAMTIFVFVATFSVTAFVQIIRGQSMSNQRRVLQEESRFLLEKIVKEFRNGTIDFPQYYADHWSTAYSVYQQLPPDETQPPAIRDGVNIPALVNPSCPQNCETILNIISPDGKNQTKIRRNTANDTAEIVKLTSCLNSGEVSWEAVSTPTQSPYFGPTYLPLSPTSIKVTSLLFYIYPVKDPSKAYADDAVQYQPTIIIRLKTQTPDGNAKMDLQTTVAARTYDEIRWDTTITNACQ